MRSNERFVPKTFEERLEVESRNLVVMSDFDDTLCHEYSFDPNTNNHHAIIDPELAAVAGELPLIIATATRGMHPKIAQILESGMVPENGILIAENGGLILKRDGSIMWTAEQDKAAVDAVHEQVQHELPRIFTMPQAMRLIAKQGLTSVIVRAQHSGGQHNPTVQTDLQQALQETVGSEWVVVNGGRSLTVQRPGVSKINALKHTGLDRRLHALIGMGDSENDIDLLQAADISIAVGERIAEHADFVVDPNVSEVTEVLKTIGRVATEFNGWSWWSPEEERKVRDRAWY